MASLYSLIYNNALNGNYRPCFVRDSGGILYIIYIDASTKKLYLGKSSDNGATWSTQQIGTATDNTNCAIGIGNDDKLHILYCKGTPGSAGGGYFYRQGTWGTIASATEETVLDTSGYTGTKAHGECALAVEENNNVHTNCSVQNNSTYYVYYTIRTSAGWGANVDVGFGQNGSLCMALYMHVDVNNYVWSFGTYTSSGRYYVKWWRYTSSLSGTAELSNPTINTLYFQSVCSDSLGNLYFHCATSVNGASSIRKYTAASASWSTLGSFAALGTNGGALTIQCDASDKIKAFRLNGATYRYIESTDYGATWSAAVDVPNVTSANQAYALTLYRPIVGTSKPDRVYSGYIFTTFISGQLYIVASDGITWDPLATKDYSRGAYANLPTNDDRLPTRYSADDYNHAATADGETVDCVAADMYAIHQFKNKGTDIGCTISIAWTGQTTIAPSASKVYLQIYNRKNSSWETLDSNDVAAANTTFTLSGSITSNMADYYDGNLWVSCRVYQHS